MSGLGRKLVEERGEALGHAAAPRRPELLFVCGIMGRVGTNFLGRLLVAHPDVCRPRGHWELPVLEVADSFAEFHARFVRRREAGRITFGYDEFARCFGDGLLAALAADAKTPAADAKYLLAKNPSSLGIEHFRAFFPTARMILLVRDGRDNVNSLLRAAGFRGARWWSPRRLASLCRFARKWAESARRMREYAAAHPDCVWVRYEDLHADAEGALRRVAEYAGLPAPESWLAGARELPVTGSGFLGAAAEGRPSPTSNTNWQAVPKSESFQPIGRWRGSWSRLDLFAFDLFAGREMRALGYYGPDGR